MPFQQARAMGTRLVFNVPGNPQYHGRPKCVYRLFKGQAQCLGGSMACTNPQV